MGTMYKEIIYRKKLPVLLFLFGIMLIFILLSDFINSLIGSMRFVCNIFFLFLTIGCCIFEAYKCSIKYKYSIIADQLIIHRIRGDAQFLVEDVKIKDIEYIGQCSQGSKFFRIISPKKYICSIFKLNKYCCVYKMNGKISKFYFEPSNTLVQKLKNVKEKNALCYGQCL
ncbi:putative membrane protein [Clostridium argentinense CDC 2741]|uniref:Putative membrane protein n=1 Tax=Clostridium argentinense CDC 2741 TaxID=1418104 RepID=A0A0C1TXT7_9CLOT|nr:hypothetical protein [Clostridium argentinense]ARC83239.1 hypothetical protein RSJ17_00865 [Clostridium argentinense]KIE45499.1 putative membrane protein [Clostridium argentinense CDC 2741]NFF41544.1 hypothetical protein [Clostridium argentinense]NFP52174.1 hypothetical protein [Clostridium argentinense]NFP74604.1 hypothetical protein [Clostridium argentinense]